MNSSSSVIFRRISDIEAKAVNWLWPGRIACGKVTMLAGNPGLGKSQITASIAAIVSTGAAWPDVATRCNKGGIIILSAEDDAADTIRPRLEAAEADLSNIFIIDAVSDDKNNVQKQFSLAADLNRLDVLLETELKNTLLIIIDPISAYLGGSDGHKAAEVRSLLAPLAKLAEKHSVAIICISHLNKSASNDALSRVTGSISFVAAARAAYLIAKDKNDSKKRLFLPIKNNLGNDQSGLAFTIESCLLANGIETSRIAWLSERIATTACEALMVTNETEGQDAIEEAKEFLKTVLANTSLSVKEIQKEADDAGCAWRTIQRAKKLLGIKAVKKGMDSGWVWQLSSEGCQET